MKVENINGRDYRLPGGLNEFQLQMYVHLIDWKRAHITVKPGNYQYKRATNPLRRHPSGRDDRGASRHLPTRG